MRKQNTLMAKTDAIENTRSADTPEADADDHGLAAWKKKRARGGKVDGAAPKKRLDRAPRKHADAPQDRALIKSMVKPDDLKPAFAKGGAVKTGKGKTSVNVIVMPQGGGAGGAGAMPPPSSSLPPMPPKPPMMPPPPPGGAPMGGPGMPPGGLPGAGPAMGRKAGGRVSYPIKDGAGGGEGRLQKTRAYGGNAKTGEGK